jgi:aspartate-semialdehyde dehydrogenase
MDELWDQTKGMYVPGQEKDAAKFTKQIAFNVIPHIDKFMEDGSTKEEWKMVAETKKIVDPKIKVTATCVRVPVFVGHSEAINIEFEEFLDEDEAREILRDGPRHPRRRQARGRRLRHARRMRRRLRHLHQPYPPGFDGRERDQPLVRLRQPAQGRGAERGADRRNARQSRAEKGLTPDVIE